MPSASVSFPAPRRRRVRPLGCVLLLLVAALCVAAPAAAQPTGAVVHVVEAEGVLDGTVAGYLEDVLATAAEEDAEVVVLQLDVRGAIGDAAERVADAVASSPVPVVTWVGPPGAWASGGGLLVARAGHLHAAAPGTLVGPTGPIDLAADDASGDVDRYAERLPDQGAAADALRGGGAVAVAPAGGETALPDGAPLPHGLGAADVLVVDEQQAVDGGLLDLTAATLPDLLPLLEGREVLVDGRPTVLDVDATTASVSFDNLGLLRQVLHAVTTPSLAYLLLVAGLLALLFEIFQPGFGVAGVSGILLAALGGYGLVVLPASLLAAAVLVVGVLLLAADLALGKLDVLTAAGTIAVAAGSWFLLPGPPPLDIPWWVIVVVTLSVVVFFVAVMTTVLRAQGNQALAGAERVVGETGVVRSMLNPEGHVFVGGALWRARAPDEAGRVRAGTPVRVLGLDERLTLEVVPLGEGDEAPEPPSETSAVS